MGMLLVAMLLLFSSFPADAQKVYKWVDDDGTVHYSTTPPPAAKTEETRVRATPTKPTTPAELPPELSVCDRKPFQLSELEQFYGPGELTKAFCNCLSIADSLAESDEEDKVERIVEARQNAHRVSRVLQLTFGVTKEPVCK